MKRFRTILATMLALVLIVTSMPMSETQAASKTITVSTTAELKAALKSMTSGTIKIVTDEKATITIPKGSYPNIKIIIDAPKATVTNKGTFKKMTVEDAKKLTEKASGNTITVNDDKLSLVIAETASVNKLSLTSDEGTVTVKNNGSLTSLRVDGEADVQLEQNGSVGKMTLSAPADITVGGTSTSKFAVTVKASASGADIDTSVPVKMNAYGDVELNLEKGAGKSTVTLKNDTADIALENNTAKAIAVTQNDGTKEKVAAGEELTTGDMTFSEDKDAQQTEDESAQTSETEPAVTEEPAEEATPVPTATATPVPTATATPAPTATPTSIPYIPIVVVVTTPTPVPTATPTPPPVPGVEPGPLAEPRLTGTIPTAFPVAAAFTPDDTETIGYWTYEYLDARLMRETYNSPYGWQNVFEYIYDSEGNRTWKIYDNYALGTVTYYGYAKLSTSEGSWNFIVSVYHTDDSTGEITGHEEYVYNELGRNLIEYYFDEDNQLTEYCLYYYDAEGRDAGYVYYDAEGNRLDNAQYTYDSTTGKELKFERFDEQNRITYRRLYTYTEEHTTEVSWWFDYSDEAYYAAHNSEYVDDILIRQMYYDEVDGEPVMVDTYNANGDIETYWYYDYYGEKVITYYSYDENGRRTGYIEKDEDGNETGGATYNADGDVETSWSYDDGEKITTYYSYDENGKRTGYIEKDEEGNETRGCTYYNGTYNYETYWYLSGTDIYTTKYEYAADGSRSKTTNYKNNTMTGETVYCEDGIASEWSLNWNGVRVTTVYTYTDGALTKKAEYEGDTVSEETLTGETIYNGAEEVVSGWCIEDGNKVTSEYDDGHIVKETTTEGRTGNTVIKYTLFDYDENDKVIKSVTYDSDNKETSRIEYEYDSTGKKTSEIRYTNGVKSRYTTYDEDFIITIYYDEDGIETGGEKETSNWTPIMRWSYGYYNSTAQFYKYVAEDAKIIPVASNASWIVYGKHTTYQKNESSEYEVVSWVAYEYDSKANKTKETFYNADGEVTRYIVYTYSTDAEPGSAEPETKITYDAAGNETSRLYRYSDAASTEAEVRAILKDAVQGLKSEIYFEVTGELRSTVAENLGKWVAETSNAYWETTNCRWGYNLNYDPMTVTMNLTFGLEDQVEAYLNGTNAQSYSVSAEALKYAQDIQTAARTATAGVATGSAVQLVTGIHNYMINQYTYSSSPESADYTFHALLDDGDGVCQSFATLFRFMCLAADIECECVIGYGAGTDGETLPETVTESNANHMWNRVKIDDTWYYLDVTFDEGLTASGNPEAPSTKFLLNSSGSLLTKEEFYALGRHAAVNETAM